MRFSHFFRSIAVLLTAAVLAVSLIGCGGAAGGSKNEMPDLAQLNELFATGSWYAQALTSTYDDQRSVDLSQMFYNGGSRQPTQEEYDYVQQQLGNPGVDVMVISREEMDLALDMVFGLTLEETDKRGLEQFIFREDTGCYYLCHGDTNVMSVTFTEAQIQANGCTALTYEGWDGLYTVTLRLDTAENGTGLVRIVKNTKAN